MNKQKSFYLGYEVGISVGFDRGYNQCKRDGLNGWLLLTVLLLGFILAVLFDVGVSELRQGSYCDGYCADKPFSCLDDNLRMVGLDTETINCVEQCYEVDTT